MKTSITKKVISHIFVHIIEIIVLLLVCFWIYSYAPETYQLPAIVIMVVVYGIYFLSTLIDDYLEVKGGDFLV